MLAELTELYLWDNRLSGDIPAELGHLSKLNRFFLCGNSQLTGCIPDQLRSVTDNDFAKLGLPFC